MKKDVSMKLKKKQQIMQKEMALHQDVWYRKLAQDRIELEKAYGLYYNFFVQKKL